MKPAAAKLSLKELLAPRAERRGRAKVLEGTPGNDGFLDPKFGIKVFKVLPGEFFVTRRNEMFSTVLGSCISACIRDPIVGVGGMNHFMLPKQRQGSENGAWGTQGNRYGAFAMESLINTLMKFGADRSRLEVKIFGGAAVVPGMSDVGAQNIEFVKQYLRTEGLRITAENVGDTCPRRVNYVARTGEVLMKRLGSTANGSLALREREFMDTLAQEPIEGEVELFD